MKDFQPFIFMSSRVVEGESAPPKISTPGKWRVLVQAPIDRGVFVLAVFLIYKLHYITEKRSKGIYHH